MKIALESAAGRNLFTAYGDDYVDVNGARHRASVIVAADVVMADWCPGPFDSLTEAHIRRVADLKPEIVLLGSGNAFRFPPPSLLAPLYEAGIGVEVMDTKAACRTYNILLAEGRRVVAALVVESTPRPATT
jgi:uncharacterized protein